MKRQRHHVENTRRKHNYLPFIVEMLRVASAKEQLQSLMQSTKGKSSDKSIIK